MDKPDLDCTRISPWKVAGTDCVRRRWRRLIQILLRFLKPRRFSKQSGLSQLHSRRRCCRRRHMTTLPMQPTKTQPLLEHGWPAWPRHWPVSVTLAANRWHLLCVSCAISIVQNGWENLNFQETRNHQLTVHIFSEKGKEQLSGCTSRQTTVCGHRIALVDSVTPWPRENQLPAKCARNLLWSQWVFDLTANS